MSDTTKVLIALIVFIVLSVSVWNLRNSIADGEGLTKKNKVKLLVFAGIFVAGIVLAIKYYL